MSDITSSKSGFSFMQMFIMLGIFILGLFLFGLFTKQTYYGPTGEVEGATKVTPSVPGANPSTEAQTQASRRASRRGR